MLTMTTLETPRIWIGCLGCYNAGNLVGEWFDAAEAPTSTEDTEDEQGFNTLVKVPASHLAEGHEEIWVMDHEGFLGLLDGEFSPSTGREVAEAMAEIEREHDEDHLAAYAAWRSVMGSTSNKVGDDVDEFMDAYLGKWADEEAYASEYADSTGLLDSVPEDLRGYFDMAAWARDMFGDLTTADAGDGLVYVFSN